MSIFRRITDEDLYRRRWQLLALTSVGAFMWPLDGSIVNVALPVMSPILHLSFTAAVWVSAAFLLTTAVLLIPAGRLADQHGRVRFYLFGIALFTVASVLCAVSMNGTWLIGARILQGAGAAFMGATSAAIVTSVFPPHERGRALGINVMSVYIGLTVGAPLGGFIVDTIGWRWIFLINLPIGVAVLVWGWSMLPRSERLANAPRLDVGGSVLLGVFLVCLLVPLTFSPEWGWGSPLTLGMLVVAAVSLLAFVILERRIASPILDLDLVLKNRLFAAANTAALLNYMALYGVSLLTAIFLQLVQGRSAALTGWLLLTMPLLDGGTQPVQRPPERPHRLAGARDRRHGGHRRRHGAAGLHPESAPLWRVAACLGVVGLGMAAFSAPNTSAIMGSVRRDQLSQASAFLGTMRTAGQALSVALLGGIAASQLGRARRPAAVHARPRRRCGRRAGRGLLRRRLPLRHAHRRRARAGGRRRVHDARRHCAGRTGRPPLPGRPSGEPG